MSPVRKRRHHYVWRHYLEAWAARGTIACYQDGRVFSTSPSKVAVKKDFYRLTELTEADLRFVRSAIDAAAFDTLKRANEKWVPIFTAVFEIRDLLATRGLADSELHAGIETAIQNVEEDLHAGIEADAVEHLGALRTGSCEFLTCDKDRALFLHFLAVQLLRTRKGEENVLRMTEQVAESMAGVNMEAVWPVLRHILATNMGFHLYMHWDSVRCRLLQSPRCEEFVTADQPILNLAAEWSPSSSPPEELDLLYPVSPQRALRLELDHPEPGVREDAASKLELDWWNHRIFRNRGSQAFASNEALLVTLAKSGDL